MKNNYFNPFQMGHLSQFLSERSKKINSLVNKLKFQDVEQDDTFESRKQRIKDEILITPVSIDAPVFKDFEHEERDIKPQQRFFDSQPSRDNYVHEVSFPYTGSRELFDYVSSGYSTYSSDHGLIKPSTSNSISVYVDLGEISPEIAVNKSQSLMRLTKEIVERNSNEVKIWNTSIEKHIDEVMEAKRDELFRIFGKK